jgi:(p)ppGpp synthase/HD superfamily hydrolase
MMPLLSNGVIIQSRLKTPPSAFKKLIKTAKRKQQLHDMIGLRIVISERKNLGTVTGQNTSESGSNYNNNHDEEAAVWRAYSIVCSALNANSGESSEWMNDEIRFKDYVTEPKPSG